MEQAEIKALLARYNQGLCSEEERARVERNVNEYIRQSNDVPSEEAWVRAHRNMRKAVFSRVNRRRNSRRMYWGAAAAVLLIVGALWSIRALRDTEPAVSQMANKEQSDVDPGGNRAVLTLADGRKIFLDDADTGALAADQGVTVSKTEDGKVVYEQGGGSFNTINTIETPRGGQYNVVLPDGTAVWLNAESSLSYPTQFAANERRVFLTGEAYFEVEKRYATDSQPIPFFVDSEIQQVEVLGTHFNVNAYVDEPAVKTTLLEGSVRIADKAGQLSRVLHPGEQCVAKPGAFTVHAVDPESAIAWKNNVFFFYHVDLPTVLRQIERWYDVDFDHVDMPVTSKLYGEIGKDKKLSAVLEALSINTGLHFELTGRRVAVTK